MSVESPSTTEARARRGEEIYRQFLRDKLEPLYQREFVAIELESAEYFIGKTSLEAILKARQKYPDKVFHVIRIGYPVVGKIGWWQNNPRIRQHR